MIKKILSNNSNKNILKLMTGASVAQAIPIAISPILTRLYSPSDFGVLALFLAIIAIFGSIVNARYELAIVLPKEDEDSINLLALAISVGFLISSFLMIIVILFNSQIAGYLGNEEIEFWLYFIPIVVFLSGLYNALNYMNTRMKTFGNIAQVNVLKAVGIVLVQVVLGLFKVGVDGLLTGQIFGHFISNARLARRIIINKLLISKVNISQMLLLAKRYKRFPLLTMWATLCNSLSLQASSFYISSVYSTSTLGYYSLVQRILGLPATLIGQSISQVFFQEAAEEKKSFGHSRKTFNITFFKLLILAIPGFLILFLSVEDLISIIFGEEWKVAGSYAKILIPLMFIKFISSPLSLINIIFEKQYIDLYWQVMYLFLILTICTICYFNQFSIYQFLFLYVLVLFIHYMIAIFISYRVSRG